MNEVVKLHLDSESIAIVLLDDTATGNCFSPAIIDGLIKTFAKINEDPLIKVVVIHGTQQFFCCGGTKEALLDLNLGQSTFDDISFYRCLMDCEIPTIAAMDGHAIGGGLTFGLYADITIFAEESFYSSNFMRYGFTPGVGATYLLPAKLGRLLGTEMLFSARNYKGIDLKRRGVTAPIMKKNEVIPHALNIAKELAEKPIEALKSLKNQQRKVHRNKIKEAVALEIEMHAKTITTPEVRQRISKLFGK